MKRNATFGLPAIMALIAAFAVFVSACYSEFPLSDVTRVYLESSEDVLWLNHPDPSRRYEATLTATLFPHLTRGQVYNIVWEHRLEENTGSVTLSEFDSVFNENNWTASATIVADTVGVVYITIGVTSEAGSVHVPHRVRVRILECTCYGCDCDKAECADCNSANGGCGCDSCQ